MAKKAKDPPKVDLPNIPEKYMNINKIEESESRLLEDKVIIEKLKKENYNLFNELKIKEHEYIISTKTYERIIDEKTKQHLSSEEELNDLKREKQNIERAVAEKFEEKIFELKDDYNKRIENLSEELEHFKEKYTKNKTKKKVLKEDLERAKKECNKLSHMLQNNIQSYEKKISDLKEQHEIEVSELKRREEEFIKSNEELMDTDIYTVYKDIKRKFEEKIHECLDYRGKNEKISDENKLVKLNLDNSESMIKKCAKLQTNQQKIIKNYKEQIEQKNSMIEKLQDDYKNDLFEMNYKLTKIIEDKDIEMKKIKHTLSMKNEENVNLRSLSQIILDQRSEIEQFFIESLEEVKVEVYKRKKAEQRRDGYFPSLNRKYEDKGVGVNFTNSNSNSNSTKKINIKDLLPEEKEKVLRMLFSKINENYRPKNYKNVDLSSSMKDYNANINMMNMNNESI